MIRPTTTRVFWCKMDWTASCLRSLIATVVVALLLGFSVETRAESIPSDAAGLTLRVLSYNIHHAEGVDGRRDVARIARVIQTADPDIVVLQEVDRIVRRSGDVDQPAELARILSMHSAFRPNILLQGGEYGNAILSRFPLVHVRNHALKSWHDGEQRGVLDVEAVTPQGIIRILGTHLDHRRDSVERSQSIATINEMAKQRPHVPTLLVGDLNAEFDSQVLADARQYWSVTNSAAMPTTPVVEPVRQIDFVLLHPRSRWQTIDTQVLPESVASDHRPILAVVRRMPARLPSAVDRWHGFPRHELQVAGKSVTVVAPRGEPHQQHPWVWHGEFFGHEPAPDVALLERGFHAVAMQVPDMLGSPGAVEMWNVCYRQLVDEYDLSPRPALVGLSRGGLYCYNWAIANPENVACLYGDAPVCDFRSWPGGKGRGPGDAHNWQLVQKLWGFADEQAATDFLGNPVDNLAPLAHAGVPLLHVFGDADEVVPWTENTGVIAERYRDLGGDIQLIRKPGIKHHPHGLTDPQLIVDFLWKHAAELRK